MSRLIKREGKPRRKRKSIILTMRYTLDIHEDDPDEAKVIGKLWTQWVRDRFSQWDEAVLQHFLYETGVEQNAKGDRLVLEGHLEKIVKNDTATFIEQNEFDEELEDKGLHDPVLNDEPANPKDTSSSEVRVDKEE